jgi:tRNA (guanine10-N2)-methyltransferase
MDTEFDAEQDPAAHDAGVLTYRRSAFVDPGESVAGYTRYLLYFVHRHLSFRVPELDSLAEMVAAAAAAAAQANSPFDSQALPARPLVWERPALGHAPGPVWHAHLPSDAAVSSIAARSMLLKVALEPWGEGDTLEALHASVAAYPAELKAPYQSPDESFRIVYESFGRRVPFEEQLAAIASMEGPTGFTGPVSLKEPKHRFWLLVMDAEAQPTLPAARSRLYFGREVAVGDRSPVHT